MRVNLILWLVIPLLLCLNYTALGQRQLLVVRGDKVIQRFKVGDSFRSKWFDSKIEHWGLITDINEFEIITSQDTIPTKEIRKVLVKGPPLAKKIGINLVKIGAFYFLIDQFNSAVIQHNPSIDDSVWKTSAVLVGAGLPLLLFKRNWKRVGRSYRLKSVGPDSRLYVSE